MNNHMMAAVLYGKEHLQVEPVAVPTIDSGDILVRVKVALTCGTDVKVFRRGYHARMIVPPAVFGHELAGDVVAVGEDVTQFSRRPARGGGQFRALRRVFFLPARSARISAKTCCSITALTPNTSAFPPASSSGIRIEIPAHVGYQDAALIEPLACVVRGFEETGVRAGRHRRHHRPGSHRPDVRQTGQAVRLPRDRGRPPQDATRSRRRAGRRRTDRRRATMPIPSKRSAT